VAGLEAAAPITADSVATALASDLALHAADLGGESVTSGDAFLIITGLPLPAMNGVLLLRDAVRVPDVDRLLDSIAARGLPHCLQVRPRSAPALSELTRRRGLVESEPEPLMVLEGISDAVERAAVHRTLSIRVLEPGEYSLHASVGAAGFGAPPELFEAMVTPKVLARRGVRAYIGTVDGAAVTTAVGVTNRDHVGVFSVATPPEHRGRGYGAAVTARAVLDGFSDGAAYAHLQSSAAGLSVYERLGFRTLETWAIWTTA